MQRFWMGLLGSPSVKPSMIISNDEQGLKRIADAAGTITKKTKETLQKANAGHELTRSYIDSAGRKKTEGTKYLKTSQRAP